jgi:hypothetical protein
VATISGGYLFDWLADAKAMQRLGLERVNPYMAMFSLALAARLLAVPLAAAIHEWGAWRWRDIVRSKSMLTVKQPPASTAG